MDARAFVKRRGGDVIIVAIAVAGTIELAVSVVPGSKALLGASLLMSDASLLFRRRFPFGAPLAATAVLAAASFYVAHGLRALAVPVLGAIVAGWMMGYGNDRRRAILGLLLQYGCVQITTAHFDQPGAGDILFTSLLIGGPWLAGHTVRVRQQVGEELEARTQELEQARDEVARAAVVDERLRIARELHDVVAHSISVMTIQAGAARLLLDEGPDRAEEPLLRVEETGRETLSEMRRLLGVLRQDEPNGKLEARPSLEHLDALLAQYREAGLPVELVVEGDERMLPQGLDLAAYRVVQEALTNTLKHAAGATAVVRVAYHRESLELTVSDSGRGRGASAPAAPRWERGGHGLVGMRERAEIYGGRLEAGPAPDGGFLVSARFPLERAAA